LPRLIRFAETNDMAAIAAIYAPYCESSAITFETEALSPGQMAQRFTRLGQKYPWVVAEIDGAVAGYAYGGPHHERAAYRWASNVSVYVDDSYQRNGVGRDLYRALFDVMRLQGFTQAIAGITLPNDPSVALHKSLGFQLMGVYKNIGYKLGAWRDVGWWQLPLTENLHPPVDTLPISEVARLPQVAEILAARSTEIRSV
jgi:L-amino acid N-acyltransferase YncA